MEKLFKLLFRNNGNNKLNKALSMIDYGLLVVHNYLWGERIYKFYGRASKRRAESFYQSMKWHERFVLNFVNYFPPSIFGMIHTYQRKFGYKQYRII